MSPNLVGLIGGGVVLLLVMRLMRGYVQTWWASASFAMVFITAGLATANSIHDGTVMGHRDEIVVACLLIIPALLGTKRRTT